MGIEELLTEKREEILRIAVRHGACNVWIFGSVARGEARLESDVDFLVNVGPDYRAFFPGGLVAALEDLLSRRADMVESARLHWSLRGKTLKEAVSL